MLRCLSTYTGTTPRSVYSLYYAIYKYKHIETSYPLAHLHHPCIIICEEEHHQHEPQVYHALIFFVQKKNRTPNVHIPSREDILDPQNISQKHRTSGRYDWMSIGIHFFPIFIGKLFPGVETTTSSTYHANRHRLCHHIGTGVGNLGEGKIR